MVSSMGHILALTILASLACTGYAIKCYHCDSKISTKCDEKFEADPGLLLDCSRIAPPRYLQTGVSNATGCIKKTLEGVAGHPQILRACFFGDVSNTQSGCQSDPALPYVKQLSCEVCTKDECNGSASIAPIAGAILLFFGVSRLLA